MTGINKLENINIIASLILKITVILAIVYWGFIQTPWVGVIVKGKLYNDLGYISGNIDASISGALDTNVAGQKYESVQVDVR